MNLVFLFTDFYFKLFLHCNPKRSYFLYFVLLKHNLCKTETCENGGKKNTGTIAFRFRQVLLYISARVRVLRHHETWNAARTASGH